MLYLIILLFIIIIFVWLFLLLKFSKGKKLNSKDLYLIEKNIKKVLLSSSSKEKIVDFDKLYHNLLKMIWYKWTFWEILKSKPSEIDDLDMIWELHKIRNKLVHDFDLLSENTLRKKSKEYEKELNILLSKLK